MVRQFLLGDDLEAMHRPSHNLEFFVFFWAPRPRIHSGTNMGGGNGGFPVTILRRFAVWREDPAGLWHLPSWTTRGRAAIQAPQSSGHAQAMWLGTGAVVPLGAKSALGVESTLLSQQAGVRPLLGKRLVAPSHPVP